MGFHRALLIGASDYDMRGVQPLPFVPGDLTRLGAVLTGHGFSDVQVLARRPGGKQISANYINARVIGFLRRVRPGDTAFILLSGHGVHARGQDFLIPEDIDEDVHPFESGCVPIDWRRHLDETPADHVVFLIDACREGIDQDSMSVAGIREWGRQQISAALRRKVAYLYGCSPAQLSLFVRPQERVRDGLDHGTRPGESFSIFSRSLADVVASHPRGEPLALGAFKEAVQDRVDELHRAYGKKGDPQLLRIVTDIPTHDFFFLPRAAVTQGPYRQSPPPGRDTAAMRIAAAPMPPSTPVPTSFGPPAAAFSRAGSPQWVAPPPAPPANPPNTPASPTARPGRRLRWPRMRRPRLRSIMLSGGLAVVAGALVGGYLWTQSQCYVGANGDHVALYKGISQNLLWIDLGKVSRDHPEIELKYLPAYQAKQVRSTIAEDSLTSAQAKIEELALQASACKKQQQRQNGDEQVTLTEDEQKLAATCDA